MTRDLERRVAELERIIRNNYRVRPSKNIHCHVYNDTAQTLTSGVLTAINFPDEYQDDFGLHDPSTNNSRVYFPAGGHYLLYAQITFALNNVGARIVSFRIDGSDYISTQLHQGDATRTVSVPCIVPYDATAGQYVEVIARQDSPGNLDTVVSLPQTPIFMVHRIGG